jgi:cytosine/adenosine deaminase-related metal-dependent hydrolase
VKEWVLRHASVVCGPSLATRAADLRIEGATVAEVGTAGTLTGPVVLDVEERFVLPGLINAHDHLDFSTFPPLGHPPYANAYDWAADVAGGDGDARAQAALAVPEVDRLLLGGVRNLLAGATAVVHHNPFHRSLARPDFPVHVLERYQFAHSPGLTPALRRTYRSTDRRIPWFVHAAEGVDERSQGEMAALVEANVVRHNLVVVHGIGFQADDARRLAEAGACVVWCPESNRHLYGATAPVAMLRAAGVRIGLGSDSPVSGVRDVLSNLAAARREGVFGDAELLDLATRGNAEVTRLPGGGTEAGARADLIVVESIERLLAGDRSAIALVVGAGRPRYGRTDWLPAGTAFVVDGHERRLEPETGARLVALLRRYPQLRAVPWLAGISSSPTSS